MFFTLMALGAVLALAFATERYNARDRGIVTKVTDDELRTAILHARQGLRFVVFLLGAIVVMLGAIADPEK
jgi:hypothetical protein